MKKISCKKLINVKDILQLEPKDSIFWHFGYDGKLYIMRQSNTPAPLQSNIASFPNPHAESNYSVAIIDIDWHNNAILKSEIIDLESIPINASMIRPIEDGLMVVGYRSFYNHELNKGEDNAYVFTPQGKLKYSMCLGDGISKLITYQDRIIVGYMDEGIFGNYGWGDSEENTPLGQAGIVVYSSLGEKIWEEPGEVDIVDVYDLSYGENDSFYYYIYPSFECIKVDKEYNQIIYTTTTEGCDDFSYIPQKNEFIYSDDYTQTEKYYLAKINGESIIEDDEVIFIDEDNNTLDVGILSSANGLTLFDASGNIYLPTK